MAIERPLTSRQMRSVHYGAPEAIRSGSAVDDESVGERGLINEVHHGMAFAITNPCACRAPDGRAQVSTTDEGGIPIGTVAIRSGANIYAGTVDLNITAEAEQAVVSLVTDAGSDDTSFTVKDVKSVGAGVLAGATFAVVYLAAQPGETAILYSFNLHEEPLSAGQLPT